MSWSWLGTGPRLQRAAMAEGLRAQAAQQIREGTLRERGPAQKAFAHEPAVGAGAIETDATGSFAPVAAALQVRIPVRLTLHSAEQLLADHETATELAALWAFARASALPLYLTLVVNDRAAGEQAIEALQPHDMTPTRLTLPSLSMRDLAVALPGWKADRIISGRALLGGDAEVWDRVDPRATLSTNVCRLLLSPDGPFFDRGWRRLTENTQKPDRYADILHAVAAGARDWGGIVAAAPAFKSASQLGPYMRHLEADGQLTPERSLDAGPRSRRTRYRMPDSQQAFWFRHVLPVRSRLLAGESPGDVWRNAIRPHVRSFVATQVPALLQAEIRLETVLGVRAREVGAIWNEGCDFPVAGTLETGAVFYGRTWWADQPTPSLLEEMRLAMRETRYGFGRENRSRLLFVRLDPDHNWERRVARAPDARFIGVDDVVGRT